LTELLLPQQNKNPIIIAFKHHSAKSRDWNSHTEEQKRKKQINWELCVSLKPLPCPISSLCFSHFWSLLCKGRWSLLKRIPFTLSKRGCLFTKTKLRNVMVMIQIIHSTQLAASFACKLAYTTCW